MAKVVLTHLSAKGSTSRPALHEINLEVADRELLAVTGPPGAGQETLLRLIAGLASPTAGDILIGDRRVNSLPPKAREVAMVFNDASLYPAKTVRENIAFGLRRRDFSKAKTSAHVTDTARALQVEELLDRKPVDLSLAQAQRVAIARALAWQPKVLLLDDPLIRLAAEERAKLRSELRQLHQRIKVTTFFATSDPGEALGVGERVLVLDEGRAVQLEEASSIYARPANIRAAQLSGTPSMNFLPGTLRKEGNGLRFVEADGGTVVAALPHLTSSLGPESAGRAVLLGIRPEDIELAETARWPVEEAPAFRMIAEYIEPRGANAILHLQTGGHDLICLSRGESDMAGTGRRVQVKLHLAKAHLFDPSSGGRIG